MSVKKITESNYKKILSNRINYAISVPLILIATVFTVVYITSNLESVTYFNIVDGVEIMQVAIPPLGYFAGIIGMLTGLSFFLLPLFWVVYYPKKGKGVKKVGTVKNGETITYYEFDNGYDADAANKRIEDRKEKLSDIQE